jgi:hypothetical protein
MHALKGANTIDEAVGQFYEDPKKYSNISVPAVSKQTSDHPMEKKTQLYSPPPYAPPGPTRNPPRLRSHTNVVIEAGNVRAQDEVRFPLTPIVMMS